jgi:uncharacterized protein YndB with AHSA1/START domain
MLQLTTRGDLEIVMTREFNAKRKLVFDALTKPELVSRWLLGPPDWTMPICEIDLRAGGAYRYVWRHASGKEMGLSGVYREVKAPARIVCTEKFDQPWYPGEVLDITTLEEKAGRTTLTLTILCDSKETRDVMLKSGMERGVAMSYDRLEELLAMAGTEG